MKTHEKQFPISKGLGDGDILAWVEASAPIKHTDWEIAQWPSFREAAMPADNDSRALVSAQIATAGGEQRGDVGTWFEFLDLDDHVTFGGKA
jgi:hypothetical protein